MEKLRRQWDVLVGNNRSPRIAQLPPQLSRFLGVRGEGARSIIVDAPQWLKLVQILLVTYAALLVQAAINKYGYPFKQWSTPPLVPSFGAGAVLCFNAMAAPLSQPRNMFIGTMISAFVGIVLMKFWLETPSNTQHLWLGAPLACGLSSVLMSFFNCVHPPAGAAAMLPLLDDKVRDLGWKYLIVELVGCCVFLVFACLFDNICARYPTHWWNPTPPPKTQPVQRIEITRDTVHTSIDRDERFIELVSELQGYLVGP